jgi:hypothetical protein
MAAKKQAKPAGTAASGATRTKTQILGISDTLPFRPEIPSAEEVALGTAPCMTAFAANLYRSVYPRFPFPALTANLYWGLSTPPTHISPG